MTAKLSLSTKCYTLFSLLLIQTMLITSPAMSDEVTVNGKALDAYRMILNKTKTRIPKLDAKTGLYVKEVKDNIFFVTDGVYQSAFVVTQNGIIVIDAPEGYGAKLPNIIAKYAPKKAIAYLIYSHAHKDHIGASIAFKDIKGLKVIAQEQVAHNLKERNNPNIIAPTITFKDKYTLNLGEEILEFETQGSYHSSDVDTFIYLPKKKFLVAIDLLSPGYVPFKGFEVTPDFHRYISTFDDVLAYDFDFLLAGHLGIIGKRQDVIESKEYTLDVNKTAAEVLKASSPDAIFSQAYTALKGSKNSDVAYRYFLETLSKQCESKVIEKWKDKLSGVDVWADTHCEVAVIALLLD